MIQSKHTVGFESDDYSPSQVALLDELEFENEDLCPSELSERTGYAQSTLCKNLRKLAEKGDVVETRKVGETHLYRSKAMHELLKNQRRGGDNSNLKEIILTLLEYGKWDLTTQEISRGSGYSEPHIKRALHQLEDEGKIEKTRTLSQTDMYTISE